MMLALLSTTGAKKAPAFKPFKLLIARDGACKKNIGSLASANLDGSGWVSSL